MQAAGHWRASDLAEGIDEDGANGQALHALLVAPEANVVLEGQQVEEGVQQRDAEGEGQEERVALRQHPLELIRISLAHCAHVSLQSVAPRELTRMTDMNMKLVAVEGYRIRQRNPES